MYVKACSRQCDQRSWTPYRSLASDAFSEYIRCETGSSRTTATAGPRVAMDHGGTRSQRRCGRRIQDTLGTCRWRARSSRDERDRSILSLGPARTSEKNRMIPPARPNRPFNRFFAPGAPDAPENFDAVYIYLQLGRKF